MLSLFRKHKIRRRQVKRRRAELDAERISFRSLLTWQSMLTVLFLAGVTLSALWGRDRLEQSIGQRIDRPIYARVDFSVPDPARTKDNRDVAREKTPSYYRPVSSALTTDRFRAEMFALYEAAANTDDFDTFAAQMTERDWPADKAAFERLRDWAALPGDAGRERFSSIVDSVSLDREWIARSPTNEPRNPQSTADYVWLIDGENDQQIKVPRMEIVSIEQKRAVRGIASNLSKRLRTLGAGDLTNVVEVILSKTLSENPTVEMDREKTLEAMRVAGDNAPVATKPYAKGDVIIPEGTVLGSTEIELLQAHKDAYAALLGSDKLEAQSARLEETLRRIGLAVVIVLLATSLLIYTRTHQRRIFEILSRQLAFLTLIAVTVLASRVLMLEWPQHPALIFIPALVTAGTLSIVYPQRFAVGCMCISAVLIAMVVRGDVMFLLALFAGVAVTAHQLTEIRSRTKLIEAGLLTSITVMLVTLAGGLTQGYHVPDLAVRVAWAGGCAMLAFFMLSGLLPFIERAFRVATSLTLLEWRDPTRELLQLLAREAPGTYNHSLVLGILAEAACERIGANGLLAQVGALYHDIGKIHKADYFVENQEGGINRHDNLAPTMSLLIIVGHVKDGMEMAKEYKLPRVLHQFIAEHHGTTVVKYFHHVASELQPRIASGRHDREVPEAEFRYSGPKPRTKESAVVMLCDGVEGAVRALHEPTVGRIEGVVHQIVQARVNDGQLSDCDMTMREIQIVEDSLVKSLCSIYHGRVAYPQASAPAKQEKISV